MQTIPSHMQLVSHFVTLEKATNSVVTFHMNNNHVYKQIYQ